jgi:hypothetical protein
VALDGYLRSKLDHKLTVVKFPAANCPAANRSPNLLPGSGCLAAAIVAREGRDLRSSGARASGVSAAR